MQIQNINNTNFRGTYVFDQLPNEKIKELRSLGDHGKIIYANCRDGNVYLVTNPKKTHLNYLVSRFIQKYNLNCLYYPNISTDRNFNLASPEQLLRLLKHKKPEELVFKEKPSTPILNKKNKLLANISDTLGFDIDESSLQTKNRATLVNTTDNTKEITISPRNTNDAYYVIVSSLVSNSDHDNSKMYEIASNGKILKTYDNNNIDGIEMFYKDFRQTLKK